MRQFIGSKLIPQRATALIIFFIILPAILNLFFIAKYGVNCVWADQWELVPLFGKLFSGNLSAADLFAQHNEHRVFIPQGVMLALGSATHYNTVAEMYFSWFLLCLICLILWKLFVRLFGMSSITLAKFIPVSWLVFSVRPFWNLLFGFQLGTFLVILLLVLTFYLLMESKRFDWRFLLAIVCGLACTYSTAPGLLIWPVGLIQIMLTSKSTDQKWWKLDIWKTIIWIIAGVLACLLYFWEYKQPPEASAPLFFFHHPAMAARFGLAALGSPLTLDALTAYRLGLLLLVMYVIISAVVIFHPRTWTSRWPFLSLIFFTVLMAAGLVESRSDWGIAAALESRYTTLMVPGIIGLYALIISVDIKDAIIKYLTWGFMIYLILAGTGPVATIGYFQIGEDLYASRRATAYHLLTLNYQADDTLLELYPWPEVVRARSEILIKYKLNVFSEAVLSTEGLTPLSIVPFHSIDMVNGQSKDLPKLLSLDVAKGDQLTLQGWAVDQNNAKAAGGVFITVDERLEIPALYGLERPDVADFHGNNNYRYSGFEASVPASVIGPGRHVIAIKVISADKKEYYQPVQVLTVDIK